MTEIHLPPESRLRAIRRVHRRHLRAEGKPIALNKDEVIEITCAIVAGADLATLAAFYGVTERKIRNTATTYPLHGGTMYNLINERLDRLEGRSIIRRKSSSVYASKNYRSQNS